MHLETSRLIFRSFTIQDLPQFAAIQADPDVMRYVGGIRSFDDSKGQLLEILRLDQETGLARFAVERKEISGLIGYCGFKPAGEFVDLGYQYSKEVWGQGIGLESAKTIREYGLSRLGITNMEAGGSIQNIASVKIMEQLGFADREELIFDGQPAIRFFDQRPL
jgi:RimJ/RimL family protein N-acetyltransferase